MLYIYRAKKFRAFVGASRYLKVGLRSSGGRNARGRITAYHRGGGNKRRYRMIDFWRRLNSCGYVLKVEYDSVRSSKIALIFYLNGVMSYVIASDYLRGGDKIFSGDKLRFARGLYPSTSALDFDFLRQKVFAAGNALPLKVVPVGTVVHNVELRPGFGGQVCRSAGTSAVILKKDIINSTLKLRSGWKIVVPSTCMSTIGVTSNVTHRFDVVYKAGIIRNKGFRPVVRGVAMNPVDHPHGGGQGKTSGGKKPLTPWGKITKNRRTVSKKKRLLKRKIRFK